VCPSRITTFASSEQAYSAGLKPLIERWMTYKRLIIDCSSRAQEYEMKQNILKWLLVTSFGYMGFNKARFGRIECHESITAFGREILLRTMEIADGMGFEILHGIVDSLWVKGRNLKNSAKS
jgi:DNA polymerase elongation subunit (family B)